MFSYNYKVQCRVRGLDQDQEYQDQGQGSALIARSWPRISQPRLRLQSKRWGKCAAIHHNIYSFLNRGKSKTVWRKWRIVWNGYSSSGWGTAKVSQKAMALKRRIAIVMCWKKWIVSLWLLEVWVMQQHLRSMLESNTVLLIDPRVLNAKSIKWYNQSRWLYLALFHLGSERRVFKPTGLYWYSDCSICID